MINNPMYQAMLAADAQQQQMANYRPTQVPQEDQQQGAGLGMGMMGLGQMMRAVGNRRDKTINQVNQIQSDGYAVV